MEEEVLYIFYFLFLFFLSFFFLSSVSSSYHFRVGGDPQKEGRREGEKEVREGGREIWPSGKVKGSTPR